MPTVLKFQDIKPGAIIVSIKYVTPAEDWTTLFWPRYHVTHAMMYTPIDSKTNNVTHVVIGKSFCVKSSTLAFQLVVEPHEEFHVFNPCDDELGRLAVEQIKVWESFGLNYDIKKFNQGKSFEKLAKNGDTIYSMFEPAHILKLYYRRNMPRARPKKESALESGVTCHGLMMDVYNVAWLHMNLELEKINLFTSAQKEYVSIKYSNSIFSERYAKRPYYFPAVHYGRSDAGQKQKETYSPSKEYTDHPRGKHPYELIDAKTLPTVLNLIGQVPFKCRTKLATVSTFYQNLLKSKKFVFAGVLDKTTVKVQQNEKAFSLAEDKERQVETAKKRGIFSPQ